MSENERVRGTLTRLTRTDEISVEQTCERIFKNSVLREKRAHLSWEEYIIKDLYDDFMIIDNELYAISKEYLDPYASIYIAEETEKGYKYEVLFYNGGYCLSEAIEEAVKLNRERKLNDK